jgi:hypothetical protein
MKVEMPTSRIEWTTVLGRLEQTVAALRHANRSDIGDGERAQRLAAVDSMAGELFTPPPRRAGGLSAHQLRALELVWEDGLDFQGDGSMLDSIAEALDGKRRA